MLFFLINIVQIVLSLPVSLNQNKERTYAATNSTSASKISKQLPFPCLMIMILLSLFVSLHAHPYTATGGCIAIGTWGYSGDVAHSDR